MASYRPERAPFNELTALLSHLDRDVFEQVLAAHPTFELEARRGPSAGTENSTDATAMDYATQRAAFSAAVGKGIAIAIEKRWQSFDGTSRWLQRWRVGAIVIGGVTGATTLGAIGFSQQSISHVAGIATAVISVSNSATEYVARGHSVKSRAAVADLRAGALKLQTLINQLEAAVAAGRSPDEIVSVMERANTLGVALRSTLDKL